MSPLLSLVDITSRHQHIWHVSFIFTGQHQTSLTSSSHGNTPTHSQVEYIFGQGLRARLAYEYACIRFPSHTHTLRIRSPSHTLRIRIRTRIRSCTLSGRSLESGQGQNSFEEGCTLSGAPLSLVKGRTACGGDTGGGGGGGWFLGCTLSRALQSLVKDRTAFES